MTYPTCALPQEPSFLEIDHVDRVFPLKNGGSYSALKNVHLEIHRGEFVTIVGHSGCGKSTLLNIIAGLDRSTKGGIVLEGREVKDPGPDRMLVFQNHSLLPWLTVRQNIALGVNRVLRHLPKAERAQLVEEAIGLVSLNHAADKYPREISGGMKQRVGIARALAIKPKVLLLDEPFGALDALTRGRLQEQLMHICNQYLISAVMITHDVDEALLLSDRVVMMTNGPDARIGQIMKVELPRPRERMEVVNNPNYYRMRGEMVEFLDRQKRLKAERAKKKSMAVVSIGNLEKVNLSLGFIPLTDCAPLVVAQEKGLFQKYGLDVTLSREHSWNSIAEGIREGRLDAAQMVTGMPLALTLGMDNKPPMAVKTALTLSRNGNAITISRKLYEAGVSDLTGLKAYLQNYPQENPEDHDLPAMAMVHRASMHNLLLRHWLASAQVEPDHQVEVLVVPPAQMISNLMADNIIGYCVGEPWNYRAVHDNLGVVVATGKDIWSAHPEKVLGVRQEWAQQYPHSYLALVKALLEACQYCESTENREELLAILSRPEYLNLDPLYIRTGFAGPYRKGTGDSLFMQDFFLFAQDNAPRRHEHLWVLIQMARWGLLKFPSNYNEVLDQVVDWEAYDAALMELELPMTMDNPDQITFADGTVFDLADPISALQSMPYSRFQEAVPFELTSNLEKKAVTI